MDIHHRPLFVWATSLLIALSSAEPSPLALTSPEPITLLQALIDNGAAPTHTSETFGYHITVPMGFRKHPDPSGINPDFDCLFIKGREQFIAVIAEDVTGAFADLDSFVMAIRGQFTMDPSQTVGESRDRAAGGVPGMVFDRAMPMGLARLHFSHWAGLTDQRGFQILAWGRGPVDQFSDLLDETLAGFSCDERAPDPATSRDDRLALDWSALPAGWSVAADLGDWQYHFLRGFIDETGSAVLVSSLPLADRRPTRRAIEQVIQDLAGIAGIDLDPQPVDADGRLRSTTSIALDQGREHYLLWHRLSDDRLEIGLGWTSTSDTSALAAVVEALRPDGQPAEPVPEIAAHLACRFGDRAQADRRTQVALDWYRHATRLAPAVLLGHQSLVELLDSQGRRQELIAAAQAACAELPDNQLLRAYLAIGLAESGRIEPALLEAEAVIAAGFRDHGFIERMLEALVAADRSAAAITFIADYTSRDPVPHLILRHSSLLADLEHHTEALAVVDAAAESIDQRTLLRHRAQLARKRDEHAAALDLLDAVVERWGEDPEVLTDRAHCLMAKEDFHGARVALERALSLQPENVAVQDLLLHIKGLLGEGSRLGIVDHLEPVPLPTTAQPPGDDSDPSGWSYHIRHRSTAIDFEPGSHHRRTDRVIYRVDDHAGVQELATRQATYDPLSESIAINEVTVYGPEGDVRWRATPGSWFQLDQQTGVAATFEKTVHINVQGLEPGCELHLTTTVEQRLPPDQMPYGSWNGSSVRPIRHTALWITAPPQSVAFDNPGQVPIERLPEGWLCQIDHPQHIRFESMMAGYAGHLPVVAFGSTATSWSELVADYLDELAPFLAATDLTLFDPLPTDPAEGIARIQDALAYQAVAFGHRGRIPKPLDTIQSSRSGDCKDHSLLIWHYLTSLGIDAHLALVSEWDHVARDLPSLDQFDHMVVICREDDGIRVIDATAKKTPLWQRCPPSLVGYHCLILDREQPDWFVIDEVGARGMERQTRITIDDQGDAHLHESITVTGSLADDYRHALDGLDPREQQERVLSWIGDTVVELAELHLDGLSDTGEPLQLQLHYHIAGLVAPIGNLLVGRLPAKWEHEIIAIPPVRQRHFPFRLRNPVTTSWQWHITAPAGWRWHEEGEPIAYRGRFLQFGIQQAVAGTDLQITGRCQMTDGLYPPEDYQDLYGEYRRVLRGSQAPLVLQRNDPER